MACDSSPLSHSLGQIISVPRMSVTNPPVRKEGSKRVRKEQKGGEREREKKETSQVTEQMKTWFKLKGNSSLINEKKRTRQLTHLSFSLPSIPSWKPIHKHRFPLSLFFLLLLLLLLLSLSFPLFPPLRPKIYFTTP